MFIYKFGIVKRNGATGSEDLMMTPTEDFRRACSDGMGKPALLIRTTEFQEQGSVYTPNGSLTFISPGYVRTVCDANKSIYGVTYSFPKRAIQACACASAHVHQQLHTISSVSQAGPLRSSVKEALNYQYLGRESAKRSST